MKPFIALFFFLPLAFSVQEPGIWVLSKQQDGIKIFSRNSAHSKFDDIKVETDLPGSLTQMASILKNVTKYTEWAYATKTCVLIKKINDNEFIYYSEIDVPWPSTNRDLYAHCKITFNQSAHSFKLIAEAIKDYAPEKKDIVRIPLSKGTWNVSALSDKMVHVEYILELDPGGTVPAWLLNLFSTKGPMETFANLKKKMSLLNQ
jgi:START domain-containing protein